MIIGSVGAEVGLAVVAVAIFALIVVFLKSCLKVVQQGCVGVVKRFGEFKTIYQPGLHVLMPLADRMDKVDIREFPRTGDQQAVITQDNVSLWVSATIFCQVTDVKLALFEVNDFGLAIDQMARTALRAVFGELTLDQSLSERETINTKMQDHMAEATLKWGVRLNRIEILDITPPTNVLQAMSEQKEAEQHKRAAILKSEGEQQAAINSAQGRKQANVLEAEGQKQAAILAAEAQKQALTELRNLVRGVHPPVLTERGLDAALSGLAALCPIPVDVHVDVPVRPKSAVEAVAYFMVAEALTNVAKHSRASHARVVVEGHGYPGTLTVMVSDDGIGGARADSPGLAGLADRVSGVDGRLSVESPSGGPTIIAAELPCG